MNTLFRFITAALIFTVLTFSVQAEQYYVVIGAFAKESNARKFTNKARDFFEEVSYSFNGARNLYYVHVMQTSKKEDAKNWTLYLKHEKGLKDVWVFTDQVAENYNTNGVLAETGRSPRYFDGENPGRGALSTSNQRSGKISYTNPEDVDPRMWEAAAKLESDNRLEAIHPSEATQSMELPGIVRSAARLQTPDRLPSACTLGSMAASESDGGSQLAGTREATRRFESEEKARTAGMSGPTHTWGPADVRQSAGMLESVRALESAGRFEPSDRMPSAGKMEATRRLESAGNWQPAATLESTGRFESPEKLPSTGRPGSDRSLQSTERWQSAGALESTARFEGADGVPSATMLETTRAWNSVDGRQSSGALESTGRFESPDRLSSPGRVESTHALQPTATLQSAGAFESTSRFEEADRMQPAAMRENTGARDSGDGRQSAGTLESTGSFEGAERTQSAAMTRGLESTRERQSAEMSETGKFASTERLSSSGRLESARIPQSAGGLQSAALASGGRLEPGGMLASAGTLESTRELASAGSWESAGTKRSAPGFESTGTSDASDLSASGVLGTEGAKDAAGMLGGVWTSKDGVEFMTGIQIASAIQEKTKQSSAQLFTFVVEDNEGKVIPAEVMLVNYEKAKKITSFKTGDHVALRGTRKNQMLTMVCEVLGYGQETKTFNLDNVSRARDINENKNGVWEVRFKLKKMEINEVAILHKTFFYEDAAVIQPSSQKELEELFYMMQAHPDYKIMIHTHCNRGSRREIKLPGKSKGYFDIEHLIVKKASDKKLTKERGEILRNYLVDQGIEKSRVSVMGWGSFDMLISSTSPDARFNDRVEIELLEAEVKP
jgi:outer membrane protein OmpA-like peptidoglycan-associated protein